MRQEPVLALAHSASLSCFYFKFRSVQQNVIFSLDRLIMNDSDLKTMLFLATTLMACFVTISSSRVNIEVFLVLRFGNWWVRHFDWKTSGPPLFITCIAGFVINTSDTQSLITQNVSSLLCKDWKDVRCPPSFHSKWQCELFSQLTAKYYCWNQSAKTKRDRRWLM